MEQINFERSIVVKKQTYTLRELVDKLKHFSSETVKTFFNQIGLSVPKKLRMDALKLVLEERVSKTIHERESLADELGYRLSWFNRYSEYQLENLLKFFNDEALDKAYLETLWALLVDYLLEKKVSEDDFTNFINKKDQTSEDVFNYNQNLKGIFFDEPNEIDGLEPDIFRPVLYKSSTLTEIREIGKKYNVDVPRRLKKNELADIIVNELKDRGEYTEELDLHVRGLSIIMMQRFAKDRDIKASTELKKEEIIEYILANASETKESYFLPSDKSIYEQELAEPVKKAEPIEEVVEETLVEEVIEEKVEKVIEEPKVAISSEQQKLLLDEIRRLSHEVKRLQSEIQEIKEMELVLDEPFDEDYDDEEWLDEPDYEENKLYHYHEHHHYHHYDDDDYEDYDDECECHGHHDHARDCEEHHEEQPKDLPKEEVKDIEEKPKKKGRGVFWVLDVLLILALIVLGYFLAVQLGWIQPLF